ncbi:MAG: hypothetical protein ACRD17_05405 [Terriglobales bacterium]
MFRLRLLLPALVAAVALAPVARAQAPQSIAAIKVTGSRRFSPVAIIQASGLRVGQAFTPAGARDAVDRLTATGCFARIGYLYYPAGRGVGVALTVQDAVQFAPAEFDNFVWFTPAAINAALHAALPLYTGQVPADGGGLDDAISRQLERLLAARGIHAQVQDVLSVGGAGRGSAVQFSVAGLAIPVAAISFPGAAPALLPRLAAAVASNLGGNYSYLVAEGWARGPARDVYLARGYLDARLGPPRVTVLPGAGLRVVVALPVAPGPQYRAAALTFSSPPQLAAAAIALRFDAAVPVADRTAGAAVNLPALRRGTAAVAGLCHLHGYFSARVSLVPALDRARHMASYRVAIAPGPRYAMGQLDIEGWPDSIAQRLRSQWALAPGQPYDGAYLRRFLVAVSAPSPGSGRQIIRGVTVFMETADPATRTVNVTIRPGG